MVAAEDGIGLFTETLTRLIDRGAVFRLLNTWRAVLQHTLVWQATKNSEALLAFQKILRRQAGVTLIHDPNIDVLFEKIETLIKGRKERAAIN
jgi:hypothetical protein